MRTYLLEQAITPQGAVSADWVLVIMVSVVGFLIVAIVSLVANHFIGALKELKSEVKVIKDDHAATKMDTALLKQSIINLNEKFEPNKMAELLFAKLKAMQ